MRKKFLRILPMLTIITCLFTACEKSVEFDVKGEQTNRIYFNSGNYTVNNYNTFNFSILNTPAGSKGNVSVSLPVFTSMPATSSLKVSISLDNSMIALYNEKNGTDYKVAPDGILDLASVVLTVDPGKQKSSDSLKITIPPAKLALLTETAYLLPVKISGVSGDSNTTVSSNQNTIYLIINTSVSQLFDTPKRAEMVGSLIPNRANWIATLDKPLEGGSMTDIFDGDTNTFFYLPSTRTSLIVDLNESVTGVSGISLKSYFNSFGITQAKVLSSIDGVNYTDYGVATLSTNEESQYIQFYKSITARYIRLDITGWQGDYIALAEFDLYK